jgi:hypothetical protein
MHLPGPCQRVHISSGMPHLPLYSIFSSLDPTHGRSQYVPINRGFQFNGELGCRCNFQYGAHGNSPLKLLARVVRGTQDGLACAMTAVLRVML